MAHSRDGTVPPWRARQGVFTSWQAPFTPRCNQGLPEPLSGVFLYPERLSTTIIRRMLTGPQIIVLATPVFFLLIAIEFVVGWKRGKNTYRLNDAMNSIGLGVLSQITGVFSKLFAVGIYTLVFEHASIWQLSDKSLWVWITGLIAYDFCYYWLHRAGHTVALFWAAHVVHHQSEDYNLSTALRQTSSGWIAGWLFYLPMAVIGFPPLVFAVVALIDLLYQYWVHTQQIGKLGWFDRWFCAPSNHRVHHAVNDKYLDKNYGGILIIWDRLFGSFIEEDDHEKIVYGTRGPLRSWNPVWANLHNYADMFKDSWHASSWMDKLRVWFKHPGWRPADVAARFPKEPFDISKTSLYNPAMSKAAAWCAALLFLAVLNGTTAFLWNEHLLTLPQKLMAAAAIVAGLWGVGVLCTPRAQAMQAKGATAGA
jgi:sterol desaturase/sphingolipid hydroxylase (fatty acid hydroxylase superfamily)